MNTTARDQHYPEPGTRKSFARAHVRRDPETAASADPEPLPASGFRFTERVWDWLDDRRERSPLLAQPPESLGELTNHVRDAPPSIRGAAQLYGLLAFLAVAVLYGAAWVLRRPLRLALATAYTLTTLHGFGIFT